MPVAMDKERGMRYNGKRKLHGGEMPPRKGKNMKVCKRALAVVLALLMILFAFAGCASGGKKVMKLKDASISENMFRLFLSRMKGNLCSAYAFGSQALRDSFWDTVMDADGTTYNDYYVDQVKESAKTYLAALQLFEDRGLKLPQSYIDEIDEEMKRLVEEEGDGSKNTLNAMLAEYGVNYKILREAYILEAKISYLREYLFGANGSKVSPALIEDYYQQNYVRFKQVFLYTYELVYETDENGDNIWYTDSGKVAYDKASPNKQKTDENGAVVKDKNGDIIYVTEDGKIAYDKKNGSRKNVMDASGNQMIRNYDSDERKLVIDRATQIMAKADEGDTGMFDTLVKEYSEDTGMDTYPNGIYLTADTNYDSPEVVEALFEMKVGEVRMIRSEYGIHIVMKYELDTAAYEKEENSDFFLSTTSSGYVFMNDLLDKLYADYLEKYKADIEVDEEALKGLDMKSVGANYSY